MRFLIRCDFIATHSESKKFNFSRPGKAPGRFSVSQPIATESCGMIFCTRPQERLMEEKSKVANEIARSIQKEWRPPVLRRLPIAATASSGKRITRANDGLGGGKGDVAGLMS